MKKDGKIYSYKEVIELLNERCEEAGGATAWGDSRKPRISFSYITAVQRGDAKLGDKILKALKLKRGPEVYFLKSEKREVVMKFEDI